MTCILPYSHLRPHLATVSGLSVAAISCGSTHSFITYARLLHSSTTRGTGTRGPAPAFAFDIDGVLKRGSQVRSSCLLSIASGANAEDAETPCNARLR